MISSISSISGIHSHLHLQVAEIRQTSWQLEEEKSNVTDNDDSNKNEKARDDEAVIIAFVLPAGLKPQNPVFPNMLQDLLKIEKNAVWPSVGQNKSGLVVKVDVFLWKTVLSCSPGSIPSPVLKKGEKKKWKEHSFANSLLLADFTSSQWITSGEII